MINTLAKNGSCCPAPDTQVMKGTMTYSPRFDVWENDDELVLYGDLPGVASEDLDIHFEKGELKIYGKVAPRNANVELLYGEYGIGDFHRSFSRIRSDRRGEDRSGTEERRVDRAPAQARGGQAATDRSEELSDFLFESSLRTRRAVAGRLVGGRVGCH